jgi:hypothetical protein
LREAKDFEIDFCCFSVKHTASIKDWVALSQESEWRDIFVDNVKDGGFLFLITMMVTLASFPVCGGSPRSFIETKIYNEKIFHEIFTESRQQDNV